MPVLSATELVAAVRYAFQAVGSLKDWWNAMTTWRVMGAVGDTVYIKGESEALPYVSARAVLSQCAVFCLCPQCKMSGTLPEGGL